MKTNKYIDAISTHVKDTPVFCNDNEIGDYYIWNLCEFKFGALFDGTKQLCLYMYDDRFYLNFDYLYWSGATLKLDDLRNMLALTELDKRTTSLSEKLSSSTDLKVFKPEIIFSTQRDSGLFLALNNGAFEVMYRPGGITSYDQYDHYGDFDTPYEGPYRIDERLLRLMIAALEASIYHDDFYPIES